jgi:hypothetical protein
MVKAAKLTKIATGVALVLGAALAHADGEKAQVIHWWTSGGESAAIKRLGRPGNRRRRASACRGN